MDFHQMDIRGFLYESVPSRFAGLDQSEFESLIRYLFEMDGYTVLPGVQSGELAHLIHVSKEGETAVILALKSAHDEEVEEKELQTADEARSFFSADHAWIITTSVFSSRTRKSAKTLGIELWDWDALSGAINQLFFEGMHYADYFKEHPQVNSGEKTDDPELSLKAKWEAAEGVESDWYNLAVTVTNFSTDNRYIHFELPALIDLRSHQVTADHWKDGEFSSGLIYAGASIRTNALFSVARLGDRPPGGRVVLTCHERKEVPVTFHLKTRLKGEACYVVTYCFSRQSEEYRDMIRYKNEVLAMHLRGRCCIRLYYLISPHVVKWSAQNAWMDRILRGLAYKLVPLFQARLEKYIAKRKSESA